MNKITILFFISWLLVSLLFIVVGVYEVVTKNPDHGSNFITAGIVMLIICGFWLTPNNAE